MADQLSVRFEHGNPTDDEVAAVVVALRTLAARRLADSMRAQTRSRWARKADLLRQPLGRDWAHPLRG